MTEKPTSSEISDLVNPGVGMPGNEKSYFAKALGRYAPWVSAAVKNHQS